VDGPCAQADLLGQVTLGMVGGGGEQAQDAQLRIFALGVSFRGQIGYCRLSTRTATAWRLTKVGTIPQYGGWAAVLYYSLEEATAGAQFVFIAVGTPSRRGDGHVDRQACPRQPNEGTIG
jgi:hypothetical protein